MLKLAIVSLVSLFIGWNVPCPPMAKRLQDWLMSKVRKGESEPQADDKQQQ